MKIFITFLFILASLFGNAQNKFSFLYSSKDSTYGYTAFNPLKMKKGNSKKSVEYSVQFLKGLRTDDNQDLIYLNRYSVDDPNYKPSSFFTNRYTGMPMNGKLGILDVYEFLTSVKGDTIKIFIDVYNKGDLFLPMGLRYFENSNGH